MSAALELLKRCYPLALLMLSVNGEHLDIISLQDLRLINGHNAIFSVRVQSWLTVSMSLKDDVKNEYTMILSGLEPAR